MYVITRSTSMERSTSAATVAKQPLVVVREGLVGEAVRHQHAAHQPAALDDGHREHGPQRGPSLPSYQVIPLSPWAEFIRTGARALEHARPASPPPR